MNELFELSDRQISQVPRDFTRYLYDGIKWQSRLIGIKGARGTGKTTLLLQHLAGTGLRAPHAVYLSLDDLYFATYSVVDVVGQIYREGGKHIALDEVHKYPGWARAVKNAYDRYPDLHIVFTGSSVIDMAKEEGDLSRRAVLYELNGLSYREYLRLAHGIRFDPIGLETLLAPGSRHRDLFPADFRPLQHFRSYLRNGFYPFFVEDPETFTTRLNQVVRMTIEYDMAELKGFDVRNARKMLQLLAIIAESVPFKPNISKLAEKIGIHRNSLTNYLHHLEKARLVHLLYPSGTSTATLQKPEKLFLDNTNLFWALSTGTPNAGALRETFVLSQLITLFPVAHPANGDLLVDRRFVLEIGGRTKGRSQISGIDNAYLVLDDLEYPTAGRLPLWMFGFLY